MKGIVMQKQFSEEPSKQIDGANCLIIASKWYPDAVSRMTESCRDVLSRAGAHVAAVPASGSLDMPSIADCVLSRCGQSIDAVICLGVVVKGGTIHYEIVVRETISGLMMVSAKHGVPVVHQVFPATSAEQVKDRTSLDGFNRGREAAHAVIDIVGIARSAVNLSFE